VCQSEEKDETGWKFCAGTTGRGTLNYRRRKIEDKVHVPEEEKDYMESKTSLV